MSRTIVMKFAVSAALIGTVAVGCKPAAHPAALSDAAPRAGRQAAGLAARASAAIGRRKPAQAVRFAEQSVALAPRAAEHRIVLGRAYIAAGRFASAEAALADALALAPDDGQAQISLALVRIALGRQESARGLLAQARGRVSESDRGLALALAGDREGGVAVLEQAARAEGADAKARQNYALGLALAGEWAESRSVAAQDLAPDQLRARMTEWMRLAQPREAWDQMAALLHVTPTADGGMPAALALAPAAGPVLAAAEPDVAAPAPAVSEPEAEVRVVHATPAFVPPPAPRLIERAAVAALESKPTPRLVAAPLRQTAYGRYVVQIGAYSSAAKAGQAWRETARRIGHVAGLAPSSAAFGTPHGTMYRVSLAGISSRPAALDLCRQIRASSGACFVRAQAGDVLASWSGATRYAQR